MSVIFGIIVFVISIFYPTIMVAYYKQSTARILICFLLCIIGLFTAFVGTFFGFVLAAILIGFKNTVKSILFMILLILINVILFAGDVAIVAGSIVSILK